MNQSSGIDAHPLIVIFKDRHFVMSADRKGKDTIRTEMIWSAAIAVGDLLRYESMKSKGAAIRHR